MREYVFKLIFIVLLCVIYSNQSKNHSYDLMDGQAIVAVGNAIEYTINIYADIFLFGVFCVLCNYTHPHIYIYMYVHTRTHMAGEYLSTLFKLFSFPRTSPSVAL